MALGDLSILFIPIDIWCSLIQLVWGIMDQTHYYINDIKEHIGIIIVTFNEYFKSIPRFVIAHFYHQQYLRKLGFAQAKQLMDTGALIWEKEKLNGNDNSRSKSIKENDSKLISVTGFLNNSSGNHRHLSIASLALEKMWNFLLAHPEFSMTNSVFIDFGCGTGLAVLSALTYPFLEVVGVELDETSASLAQKHVDKFRKSSLLRCTNVKILCKDMSNLEFSSIGCTITNKLNVLPAIILYMYEPLWTLAKEDAIHIYRKILKNAKSSGRKVIVMYFFAGIYSGDATPVFQELGSVLLYKEKYHSLFFGPAEDLYIYEL